MMKISHFMRSNSKGFSIIELMTVLVIIMLLAMIGFPTYQEYQNRTHVAEAETVMGAIEKNLRTYFFDHGSFYSASPTPAVVPGLASLGDPGVFNASGGWNVIGPPVAEGAEVNFSYQVFAGRTPADSTTPIVNENFFNPTDDMNLIRRAATASNSHFRSPVRVASHNELLRLDWSDFNLCASASDYDDCKKDCSAKSGTGAEELACIQKYCADKQGAPSGKTAAQNCVEACVDGSEDKRPICEKQCSQEGDSKCDSGDVADIDCYHDSGNTAAQNCSSACSAANPGSEAKCEEACNNSESDSKCSEDITDIDCYSDDSNSDDPAVECYDACVAYGKAPDDCKAACDQTDGKCSDSKTPYGDQDCYGSGSCSSQCSQYESDKKADCEKSCEAEKDAQAKSGGLCLSGDANCLGGGGGGGGGGSPPPGGGEGETDEGQYSGDGGGGSEGDGSSETDQGETSDDDNGSVETSNAECASFGISRPIDLGVEQNKANHNWAAVTGIASFTAGVECTAVVRVIQAEGTDVRVGPSIKINLGE